MLIQPVSDPKIWRDYLRDEAGNIGHAGAVARLDPRSAAADAAAAMAYARQHSMPVTFSARRTSLTGAAVPEGGLLVLLPEVSSPNMVSLDRRARTATAPPWVLLADVQAAAEAAGLFLPPDPTSSDSCSLGGAVACNASGARSHAYGAIGSWVIGLTVVLAGGEVLRLSRGRNPAQNGTFRVATSAGTVVAPCPAPRPEGLKSACGYGVSSSPDLIDLFIGSEGTLGFIASVTVRLIERPAVLAALVFWSETQAALDLVALLQDHPPPGVSPMSIDWFDRRSLELASSLRPELGIPPQAQVALFVEQACVPGTEDEAAAAWCEALGAADSTAEPCASFVARTPAQQESMRAFRRAVPEAVNSLMRSRGLRKVGTDLAYPRGWLADMMTTYDRVLNDIPGWLPDEGADWQRRWRRPPPDRLDFASWGHIGDNHLHVNLLPNDPAEASLAFMVHRALARHCAGAGGSVSAEHGIGKTKRELLAEHLSAEQLATWRAIKRAFDPAGILAPGNIFT